MCTVYSTIGTQYGCMCTVYVYSTIEFLSTFKQYSRYSFLTRTDQVYQCLMSPGAGSLHSEIQKHMSRDPATIDMYSLQGIIYESQFFNPNKLMVPKIP